MDYPGPDLLTCRDVRLHIGGQPVLNSVSFSVQPGEILAVIGPAKSGKTMLLWALNRLLDQVDGARLEGDILWKGQSILVPDTDLLSLRHKIGMIQDKPALFHATIYQNLVYGPKLGGIRSRARLDEIVEQALRIVGLWETFKNSLDRFPRGLDLLTAQKLSIARTLCTGPELLLADDPTLAMDYSQRLEIEEILQRICSTTSILLTTRNHQQAARIYNRCALLLKGEVVEISDTTRFFSSPTDPRTELYLTGHIESPDSPAVSEKGK